MGLILWLCFVVAYSCLGFNVNSPSTTNNLKKIFWPQDLAPRANNKTLLFISQILFFLIVGLSATELMLSHYRQDLINQLSNERFVVLKNLNDRLNHGLRQQQQVLQAINLMTLIGTDFDNDDSQFTQTQSQLRKLHYQGTGFEQLLLLDEEGGIRVKQYKAALSANFIPDLKAIQSAIQELTHSRLYVSPILIDEKRHLSYVWMLLPTQTNGRGIHYLLATVNLQEMMRLLTGDYELYPVFMSDQYARFIPLTLSNAEPLPMASYQELWPYMNIESQGQHQLSMNQLHTVFLRGSSNGLDKVYFFSTIDLNKVPMVTKLKSQFRGYSWVLIIGLCTFLYYRRYHHQYIKLSHETIDIAEQLYQAGTGTLIFDQHGYCISANQNICHHLDCAEEALLTQRFSRLFCSHPLHTDMIWQIIRHSGNWEGELQLAQKNDTTFRVNLRCLMLAKVPFILLRLTDSPRHQRQQAHQLKQYKQLADSASALALLNQAGNIVLVNRALTQISNRHTGQLLEQPWYHLLPYYTENLLLPLQSQLQSRGQWQGQLWLQRSDGSVCRCIASLQSVEHHSNGDEGYRTLTFTPIKDKSLYNDEDLSGIIKRRDLSQQVMQSSALLVLQISNNGVISNFSDSDQLLYQQHLLLNHISALLPPAALLNKVINIDELQILLPHWDHQQAIQLAADIIKHLEQISLEVQVTIGLSEGDDWDSLYSASLIAVERAKNSNQPYCLAYSRQPAATLE